MTEELFAHYARKSKAYSWGYWMRWKKYLADNTSFKHVHHPGKLYYLTMVRRDEYAVFRAIERIRRGKRDMG